MAELKETANKNEEQELESTRKEFVEALKKDALLETALDEKTVKTLEQMSKEAKMPLELKDGDIVLGERELDIRKLSKKNLYQMFFRQAVLNSVYLRQVVQSQVDVLRLVMIILKKLGVEDIIKATDDLQTELTEEMQKKAETEQNNVKEA